MCEDILRENSSISLTPPPPALLEAETPAVGEGTAPSPPKSAESGKLPMTSDSQLPPVSDDARKNLEESLLQAMLDMKDEDKKTPTNKAGASEKGDKKQKQANKDNETPATGILADADSSAKSSETPGVAQDAMRSECAAKNAVQRFAAATRAAKKRKAPKQQKEAAPEEQESEQPKTKAKTKKLKTKAAAKQKEAEEEPEEQHEATKLKSKAKGMKAKAAKQQTEEEPGEKNSGAKPKTKAKTKKPKTKPAAEQDQEEQQKGPQPKSKVKAKAKAAAKQQTEEETTPQAKAKAKAAGKNKKKSKAKPASKQRDDNRRAGRAEDKLPRFRVFRVYLVLRV